MKTEELIRAYRENNNVSALRKYFAFEFDNSTDKNLEYRIKLTNDLLDDYSIADIELIRAIFEEELRCEKVINRHDNLYQLCFYLYDLAQFEDVFLIYRAKYQANNMDTALMLDREMLSVNHSIDDVIEYVENQFKGNSSLETKYPTLLKELKDLQDYPDYESLEEYDEFIHGYFFTTEIQNNVASPPIKKKWWKFWS